MNSTNKHENLFFLLHKFISVEQKFQRNINQKSHIVDNFFMIHIDTNALNKDYI